MFLELLLRINVTNGFFFFNKIFREIISLSIVLYLFIYNIGSKHDRETVASKLTFITFNTHGEFLGNFCFAATKCFTDYSSNIKR